MAKPMPSPNFSPAPTTTKKPQPKPLPPQKTGARTPFFLPGYVNDTYHVQNSQSVERARTGLVPGAGRPGTGAGGPGTGGFLRAAPDGMHPCRREQLLRVCLKIASRQLCVPLCGRFDSDEGCLLYTSQRCFRPDGAYIPFLSAACSHPGCVGRFLLPSTELSCGLLYTFL